MMDEPIYISIEQARRLAGGVSRSTLGRWIAERRFDVIQPEPGERGLKRGRTLIHRISFLVYLNSRHRPPLGYRNATPEEQRRAQKIMDRLLGVTLPDASPNR